MAVLYDGWQRVLERFDTPETFFYFDPPYVLGTRSGKAYDYGLSDADHEKLVIKCLSVRGKVLLSGYENGLYKPLLESGWRSVKWKTACHAVGMTRLTGLKGAGAALAWQARTEVTWVNYTLDG